MSTETNHDLVGITPEEEEEYLSAFQMFDLDGSGKCGISTSADSWRHTQSIVLALNLLRTLTTTTVCAIGKIELSELKQVMLSLGQNPSDKDLQEMINIVDANGDGEIDFEEFLVMMSMRAEERDTDGELLEAFKLFDLDGGGTISRNELETLMKCLGQDLTTEEITQIIDEVDVDGDGEISFEEFKMIMVRSFKYCIYKTRIHMSTN